MKRTLLVLLFMPFAAAAQQDCVIGSHQFKDGACGAYILNMCLRPLNCTLYVEGFTADGRKVSDSKPFALQHQGSGTHTLPGVARCGDFDVQCSPAAPSRPQRR